MRCAKASLRPADDRPPLVMGRPEDITSLDAAQNKEGINQQMETTVCVVRIFSRNATDVWGKNIPGIIITS